MKTFSQSEQGSERLRAFTKASYETLVPASGSADTIHGELLRANDRILSEALRNGMANFYNPDETLEENYYGSLLLFMLETLIKNVGNAVDREDVEYFKHIRSSLEADRQTVSRLMELEDKDGELTPPEETEYARLEQKAGTIAWEDLYDRAERCIANWCVVNSELVPYGGDTFRPKNRPKLIEELFNTPPVEVCVRCSGKGWIAAQPGAFPEKCVCQ